MVWTLTQWVARVEELECERDELQCDLEAAEQKISDLGAELEGAQSANEWISVNVRLPDEGVKTLTVDASGKVDCLAHYGLDGWDLEDTYPFEKHPPITHWQPLPKGPSAGGEDED